jgi:hypothetical protein
MLSIVVSWRDRIELRRALPSLIETARRVGGELVIVNFSGSQELLAQQTADARGPWKSVTVASEAYFNKAAAQNIGAHSSDHPLLFFCDCDIILDPEQVLALAHKLQRQPEHFATLAGVRESELNSRGGNHVVSFGYELRLRTADGRVLQIVDNEEDIEHGTRQAPGLLMVRRSDFLGVNGYNGELHGWGWEDQDMISRLTLGQGLTRITEGQAIHISHGDEARVAFYPAVASRWESRDRMFRKALSNYDERNFSGTYDRDVARLAARLSPQVGERREPAT